MFRHGLSVVCVSLCLCVHFALAGDPAPDPAAEKAKIEFLLRAVGDSKVAFVRNGTQYDGPKAADHLRTKWEAAGDKVKTAAQFIETCATKSSMSGETYEIVLSDKKTRVPCAEWLGTVLFAHELTVSVPSVAAPGQPKQSAVDVLKYIETSDGIFLRPGGERTNLSGREFSAHLQGKAVLGGFSLTGSASNFIVEIASASSLHGTDYKVKLPDGAEIEAKVWLAQKFRIE